ncbi:metal-dependent hydrolase [Mycobacteroides chelonae]
MSSATAPVTTPDAPPRVRRIKFPFADSELPSRYFIEDDIALSHFVAVLSGGFPAGEEAFIRSVRKFADQITDPVLKKRVAGFIGQEAVHGQQHRQLNQRLIRMGYAIGWLDTDQHAERMIRLENRFGRRVHLATTAAAEHYTAVLAERVLSSQYIQDIPGEPEVWNLLNWHTMEELEHKSVAFDVYRAVGGTEFARIVTMAVMLAFTPTFVLGSMAASIVADPYARSRPVKVARQAWKLFRGPVFRGLMPELAKYLRPGFHPDDIDTTELLAKWQLELFGVHGSLVDHLK